MANLLPRSQAPFPALSEDERARVETRARFLLDAPWSRVSRASDEVGHRLEPELDELEEAPSLPMAQALLAEVDAVRAELGSGGAAPEVPLRVAAKIRVIYGDTDRMGVVYHATYLRYLEHARVEFIRSRLCLG